MHLLHKRVRRLAHIGSVYSKVWSFRQTRRGSCWRLHLDRARWIVGEGLGQAIEAFGWCTQIDKFEGVGRLAATLRPRSMAPAPRPAPPSPVSGLGLSVTIAGDSVCGRRGAAALSVASPVTAGAGGAPG